MNHGLMYMILKSKVPPSKGKWYTVEYLLGEVKPHLDNEVFFDRDVYDVDIFGDNKDHVSEIFKQTQAEILTRYQVYHIITIKPKTD